MKKIIIIFVFILMTAAIIYSQTRRTKGEGFLKQTISSPEGQTINVIIKACDPDAGVAPIVDLNGIDKPPISAVLNKAHPLAQGLAGAWIFNEGSGNIVYDKAGTRNATIGTGGVWVQNGIELDGTYNSKIALSSKYLPSQKQYWSAVARYRYDALNKCVVSAAAGQTYAFNVLTNTTLYTKQGNDQEIVTKAADFFTPPQTRTFIVTHDFKTGKWYQDGTQIWTIGTFTGQDLYVWQVDCLTGGTSGQNALDGVLEFVYLYDRVLTPQEAAEISAKPYSMFFSSLSTTSLITISSDSLPPGSSVGTAFVLPASEIPDVTNPANGYSPELQAECLLPTASWFGINFSWTPSYTQTGSYSVYMHAVDNKQGEDWVVYQINITNQNRPPQL